MTEKSVADLERDIANKLAAIHDNGSVTDVITNIDTSVAYQDSFYLDAQSQRVFRFCHF